jgi:predicted ATPase
VIWSIRRARTASPIPQATTPFVGREAERDELREVLDAALAGRGSLVMISGDAGVGKSRLAEDLAEEASRRGFLALSGRCEDLEDPPAFMPLLEILRTAMSLVPQQVFRESMGAAFSGIASLLPELAEDPSGAQPDREALLDACRDFLERTSRRRPTLLILEHLQWADAESVALIRHSADRLAELPAVLVGLYRPGGLADRPLGAALDELLALPVVRSLQLQRSVPGST